MTVEETPATSQAPTDTDAVDTRATTFGAVPIPVSALLLILAFTGIIVTGTAIGYPATELALIFGTGLLAAIGVRIASTPTPHHIAAGVTLLWTAAVIFAFAAISLTTTVIAAGGSIIAPLCVAAAVLVTPFGLLGSTLHSFGHGAARNVLSRYLIGVLIVTAIIAVLVAQAALRTESIGDIAPFLDTISGGIGDADALHYRVGAAIVLYAAFCFLARGAIHAIPVEIFVPAHKLDRVDAINHRATQGRRIGLLTTVIYAVVAGTSFLLQRSGSSQAGEITHALTQIGATPLLLYLIATINITLAAALVLIDLTQRVPDVTGANVVEMVGPPLLLVFGAGVGTMVAGDRITSYLLANGAEDAVSNGGFIHQLLTGQPVIVLLVLLSVALLASATVLSTPSLLASIGIGDTSLIGIISAVLGLTALVVIATIDGQSYSIIVGTVLLTAVVWELGEYSTVAVGELKPQTSTGAFQTGLTTIITVHAVGTTVVAISAVIAAMIAVYLFGSASLPVTTAIIALIFSGVSLAVLINLIAG